MITVAQLRELAIKAEQELGLLAHEFVAYVEAEYTKLNTSGPAPVDQTSDAHVVVVGEDAVGSPAGTTTGGATPAGEDAGGSPAGEDSSNGGVVAGPQDTVITPQTGSTGVEGQ